MKPTSNSKNSNQYLSSAYAFIKRFGLDGFILALMSMILLAYFFPHLGSKDSPVPLSAIANYGVSLIFFFYGLRLSPQKLLAGIANWRLHLLIHSATFLVFPLLVIAARLLIGNVINDLIWLGIFFLACLPSTVSSSVVMVSIARGNIPAAIFNASISTLIGVFITPLWMGIFMNSSTQSLDLLPIILKLTLQVLLPVILGILLHSKCGAFAERHRKQLRYFDQSIILLIVFTAFCESFAQRMFQGYSLLFLILLGVALCVLFYLVYGIIYLTSKLLKFNREDKITAMFCGSKKSLVHGTVMSKILFAHSPYIGIILLPIMMYHALQLIMVSIIAQRMARRKV